MSSKEANSSVNRKLIVQKYGGATLADPSLIKKMAARISETIKDGTQLIVVVSAMGKTTNSLIDLAQQVSANPTLRELDMLLTVGERISMSLVSMALNDLGCPAISFTGSQAGIFTDKSHINAFIRDVKPIRIQEALEQNKVVILAGFQGVSPETKEITTLGRGGSDTSAVAMAASFHALRCEILKDVPGVFSADPRIVKSAKPIHKLNYDQMMDMTFWGAKVLHYRSVELAKIRNVTLYIGPASNRTEDGTLIEKGNDMFESNRILSLNSHENVLQVSTQADSLAKALSELQTFLEQKQVAFPQLLNSKSTHTEHTLLITGPQENISAIKKELQNSKFKLVSTALSTVTMTCTGITSAEVVQKAAAKIEAEGIQVQQMILGAMSATFVLENKNRERAINSLHELIT